MKRGYLKGENDMEEIKQFDIWICDFCRYGVKNFEGMETRPCVVVSNNMNNSTSERITVVPLTTSSKKPFRTHCIIGSSQVTSVALCESVTTIYRSQLTKKVGELNDFEKMNVLYCLKQQFNIN